MGRPVTGPMSTFPNALKEAILHLRKLHPGWGPATLLMALRTDGFWRDQPLPSRAEIARLLKQAGLTRRYQPHHDLSQPPRVPLNTPHQEWQMDAQGIMRVQVRFTRKRCPTDHGIIERTHQMMTAQALLGQTYASHADLWAGLDERRAVLNQHLPSRALSHKAPLQAYPHAIHSGRMYRPEWEEELLCLERVWTYLRACRWFRRIRTNGFFCLGGYSYYLGKHVAHLGVAVRFDSESLAFHCQLEGSEEIVEVPAQGLTKADLMGELAAMQSLPTYQLALPFSQEAWRQLEYAKGLAGTTL